MAPFLDIYRHRKTGRLLIQNWAPETSGAAVGWGPPKALSLDELRAKGVGRLLDELHGFASRSETDVSMRFRRDDETDRRFVREHYCVGVRLQDTACLVLEPTYHCRGGYVAEKDDELTVSVRCTTDQLISALSEAFDRCR